MAGSFLVHQEMNEIHRPINTLKEPNYRLIEVNVRIEFLNLFLNQKSTRKHQINEKAPLHLYPCQHGDGQLHQGRHANANSGAP